MKMYLTRAKNERQLMRQVMKRQCRSLGHALRKIGIGHQVITGRIEGKRDRTGKRQRQTFLGWIGKCLDSRCVDIIRLAESKTLYHAVTASVRI